jgi:hypothetical protein
MNLVGDLAGWWWWLNSVEKERVVSTHTPTIKSVSTVNERYLGLEIAYLT